MSEPLMYALKVSDGEEPSYRLIRQPQEAEPGEVVVKAEPTPGHVWDAASGELGPPTEAERLEKAKAQKIDTFARCAIDDLAEHFTGSHGRDELQAVHNATLIAICETLGIPLDERMRRVDEVQRKAFAKKAEVEAATSAEELEAVRWEEA